MIKLFTYIQWVLLPYVEIFTQIYTYAYIHTYMHSLIHYVPSKKVVQNICPYIGVLSRTFMNIPIEYKLI